MEIKQLEKIIKSTWPAEGPWNTVRSAKHMLAHGELPQPVELTRDQVEIFVKTHKLMCGAASEFQAVVADAALEARVWKILLRGAVCERLVSAPGENSSIKVINAMRGERKAWPSRRREHLWEQLSYPAGLADAMLAMLDRIEAQIPKWKPAYDPNPEFVHLIMPSPYQWFIADYRRTLTQTIPKLRRCKKLTQERRHAR